MLPSSLTAGKHVPSEDDPAVEVLEAAPYARVPAAAQPVDDRVSFGELAEIAEIDSDRQGDVYFVTIAEPAQSVLSSWIGSTEPEILGLTEFEKFGRADAVAAAHPVAADDAHGVPGRAVRRPAPLGYEDARIVAGDVVVADLVCVEPGEQECTTFAPADESLEPGDTIGPIDGVAAGHRRRPRRPAGRQAARRRRQPGHRAQRRRRRRPSRSR